jgi:HD-like signal output (HDOD) protein
MARPRARVVRAEVTEHFLVTCPNCQARISLETQVERRTGWRRLLPPRRAPLLMCLACHAVLDPELPRGRRITQLRLSPAAPLVQVQAVVSAPAPPAQPPGGGETDAGEPPWENEPDILQYRRRRRGGASWTKEQAQFRERVIQQLKSAELAVPVLPQVATELTRLFRSPEIDVSKVIEVIQRDAMITATLLKLANSALYRSDRPCTTVKAAVERMGFAQVQGVVYSVTMSCKVLQSAAYGIDAGKLHRHALGVAMLARMAALRVGMDPGQAFLAGILHDVGKVVILDACHRAGRGEKLPGVEAVVHELMDLHHARLGGVLCVRWQLPEFLQATLRHHHDTPPEKGTEPVAVLVNLADNLAHVLGLGVAPVRVRVAEHPALAALGMSSARALELLKEFDTVAEEFEGLAQLR